MAFVEDLARISVLSVLAKFSVVVVVVVVRTNL